MRFVIDEDLPRSTARTLSEKGFEVYDVRDHGLRGREDDAILEFAQRQKAILITCDLGFGNQLKYPVGSPKPDLFKMNACENGVAVEPSIW